MQTKQEIFDQVSELLVVLFEVDKEDITLESRLYEDLDIDSIAAVDKVVCFRKVRLFICATFNGPICDALFQG